jgi:ABC-2 type transport system permease protein
MSANIYLHEFRARLKSVIIWSLSLVAILFFVFSIFPTFAKEADLMNQMMEKLPAALLAAFGLDKTNLASVLGFYGFAFIFVQLCLAIQAANYGFGLVSIEESELTADFLLSKPVSRAQILTSKLLAALSSLVITNLVLWAASFAAILIFRGNRDFDPATLALVLASALIFQLFFLSVGLVVSLLVRRVRNVTPYSLGLGFGTYVLSAFSGVFGDVKLEYITPFKHLAPNYIILHQAYDTPLVLLNVMVTLVSLAVSYWLYLRRDIPSVS